MPVPIEFNKTYLFDLSGSIKFGELPVESLHLLLRDGRVASKFLEHLIPIWFNDISFVDGIGYDHVEQHSSRKFDLKGFTKGGAIYAPSAMIGAGRKIRVDELHHHANTINYIFSDIIDFPVVKIIFKKGPDIVTAFPSGRIGLKFRQYLFG